MNTSAAIRGRSVFCLGILALLMYPIHTSVSSHLNTGVIYIASDEIKRFDSSAVLYLIYSLILAHVQINFDI